MVSTDITGNELLQDFDKAYNMRFIFDMIDFIFIMIQYQLTLSLINFYESIRLSKIMGLFDNIDNFDHDEQQEIIFTHKKIVDNFKK